MVLHPGGHLAPAPDPFDPLLLLPQATDADKRWAAWAAGWFERRPQRSWLV